MTATNVRRAMLVGWIAAILGASSARADFNLPSFFVDDPAHNSHNWADAISVAGGKINGDVNFQTMPTGFLDGNYYNTAAHPDGVTLFASGRSINSVVDDGGPGQAGQVAPTSTGEGHFAGGNYLRSDSPLSTGSSLLIKFADPVMAVGLSTIDYFGSDSTMVNGGLTNTLTLSVFDVKGAFLGSASAVRDDFQSNFVYFMGYVAPTDLIGSAVFSRGPDADNDVIGITGIGFAVEPGGVPVPEPSSLVLMAAGATALAAWTARRRRRAA